MRQIPDQLLELIAGGGACDTSSIPCVEIPGPSPMDPYPYDPNPYYPGGGGGGGGGGGEPTPCHHSSPVPSSTPANVNLDALRDKVAQVSNEMKAMGIDKFEKGALIYRSSDGVLHTTPIAEGTEDKSPISFQPVAGDKIVAWVHSHPLTPGVDERFPSTPANSTNHIGDTGMARAMLANTVSVDPGMLMYILDAEHGQTYEYTAAGSDNRALGNTVTNDATC